MKVDVLSLDGKKMKIIDLPNQFNEEIRPSLMKRAVLSLMSRLRQAYGATPLAGMRHSTKLSRRRKHFKTSYGKGISRVPRKTMSRRGTNFKWVGAQAPGMVGGRRAHAPKLEKNWELKINKKERQKALRSAFAFSIQNQRSIIVEDKLETIKKSKDIKNVLEKIGLNKEVKRISESSIRSGRGKTRGRAKKVKIGPLFIFSNNCDAEKAVNNLQGCTSANVKSLNNLIISQGQEGVRYLIWSEKAIEEMKKGGLYL